MKAKSNITSLLSKVAAIALVTLMLSCGTSSHTTALSEREFMQIEKQALVLAKKWLTSWNGEIDSENMMSNYHPGMKYVWRGVSPLGNYQTSKEAAESMPALTTNYQLTMSNVDITVIDRHNAIVFFHFVDNNGSPYGNGAVSLVMTKGKEWKIIYVHESTIEGE